jgi:hypothetical protein
MRGMQKERAAHPDRQQATDPERIACLQPRYAPQARVAHAKMNYHDKATEQQPAGKRRNDAMTVQEEPEELMLCD